MAEKMNPSQKRKVVFVCYSHSGSMALRIFASILKERYDIVFLFIEDLTYRKSVFTEPDVRADWVADFCIDCDYVLFSATHYHAPLTFTLADAIRASNPRSRVIIGGPHAVACPASCLEHADYVCVFEGEGILDLLGYLDSHREPKSIGNFVCRPEDLGRPLTWIEDLDSLPVPDYHAGKHFWYTSSGIISRECLPRYLYYQSLRGCIFRCSYCDNAALNKMKQAKGVPLVRLKNMTTVLRQLKELKGQLPNLRQIDFSADDNFLARSLGDIEAFAAVYDESVGVPLVIIGDLRSPHLSEKIEALARVRSLHSIDFGIQTGSEEFNARVFNRFQKNEETLRQYRGMRLILGKDVRVMFDIIYGHPEEGPEDLLATINLMLRLKGAAFSLFNYTPVPTALSPVPDGGETRRSYSSPDPTQLRRFSFYYFLIFLIKHLNTYSFSFLLPGHLASTKLFRFFNMPLFRPLYGFFVRLSIWVGLTRTKLTTPHSGLA